VFLCCMEQEQDLVILGAGGEGMNLLGMVKDINENHPGEENYNIIGFLDNDETKHSTEVLGVEVMGPTTMATEFSQDVKFINTIAGATYFWEVPDIISETGIEENRFETIIHPDSHVGESAEIGSGAAVYPNSVIYEKTKIGNHVQVKSAKVGSSNTIGDYTIVNGDVVTEGNLSVGESCWLGINSTIRSVSIANRTLVGMGSVVVKDVEEKGTVIAGNPAEYLREIQNTDHKYENAGQ